MKDNLQDYSDKILLPSWEKKDEETISEETILEERISEEPIFVLIHNKAA